MANSHVKIIYEEGSAFGLDDNYIYVQIRESVLNAHDTQYKDYIMESIVVIDCDTFLHNIERLTPPLGYQSNYSWAQRIGITEFDALLDSHPNKAEIIQHYSYLASDKPDRATLDEELRINELEMWRSKGRPKF